MSQEWVGAASPRRCRANVLATIAVPLLLAAFAQPCFAGGSDEFVSIERLQVINSIDYVLQVVPRTPPAWQPPDPYMGGCTRFTVHGTYRKLRGAWFRNPKGLTREAHVRALHYLKEAFDHHTAIRLGWMGTGFEPLDPKDRCIVSSRALRLFTDEEGTAVYSHHDVF